MKIENRARDPVKLPFWFFATCWLLLPRTGMASVECAVSYTFLFADASGVYILEEMEGDCGGTHLKRIIVDKDSIRAEEDHDWKEAPQRVHGSSRPVITELGFAEKLVSADGGWEIETPSANGEGLLDRRAPLLHGLNGKPVYWDGCGKYASYKLKAALHQGVELPRGGHTCRLEIKRSKVQKRLH